MPQNKYDKFLKMFLCCGSKTTARHLKSCYHYDGPHTKKKTHRTLPRTGKMYIDYLEDEALRYAKRYRCYARASIYGIIKKQNSPAADADEE